MCKEMPVIPVNRVVNKKRMIGKMESQGGGEAQKSSFCWFYLLLSGKFDYRRIWLSDFKGRHQLY
jgi:hypothetical protein